ncbi:MAG: 6-phosphofructokinase [Erysipelotrichaceae bacterium]
MENKIEKIAVMTSGGDSPGMNAAIRAVVRAGIKAGLEVYGIEDGYLGMVENRIYQMQRNSVSDIMIRGGTILGSARLPEFKEEAVMQKAIDNLNKLEIGAVVTIGGDGTYKGALALSERGINCIGLPGTIDNDIASTDYTIGFDTALNTIIEAVDKLRDTSSSHHRCSIVEVMGNRCGDLALFSGISSGAEIVINSETGYDEQSVIDQLNHFDKIKKKRHSIVVISEKLTDVYDLAKKVSDQTPFSGRATVLGHLQRGGSPTGFDRVLATRMGDFAVAEILRGTGGVCIGIINNQVMSVPIETALMIEKPFKNELYEMQKRLV